MSNVDNLLSRLEGIKQTGAGRWIACCPAHDDKHPSFNIRELDDERILIKCQAGCSAEEILSAIGLTFSDLYPPREIGQHKPERRPFPAADILRCIGFEALVVLCAASSMLSGEPMTAIDRDRLSLASARIQSALDAGGLSQ